MDLLSGDDDDDGDGGEDDGVSIAAMAMSSTALEPGRAKLGRETCQDEQLLGWRISNNERRASAIERRAIIVLCVGLTIREYDIMIV